MRDALRKSKANNCTDGYKNYKGRKAFWLWSISNFTRIWLGVTQLCQHHLASKGLLEGQMNGELTGRDVEGLMHGEKLSIFAGAIWGLLRELLFICRCCWTPTMGSCLDHSAGVMIGCGSYVGTGTPLRGLFLGAVFHATNMICNYKGR